MMTQCRPAKNFGGIGRESRHESQTHVVGLPLPLTCTADLMRLESADLCRREANGCEGSDGPLAIMATQVRDLQ